MPFNSIRASTLEQHCSHGLQILTSYIQHAQIKAMVSIYQHDAPKLLARLMTPYAMLY